MSFALSKIFAPLLEPGTLAVALLGLATLLLLWGGRARRWGIVLTLCLTLILGAFTALPVGDWAVAPLENRFPPATLPERVDGIIVLGGMVDPDLTASRNQPTVNGAAERLIEFVGLARRWPQAKLIFSGGSGSLSHPEQREAPVARAILERLGFPAERVMFESDSRNTWENVLLSQKLVQPQPGEVWVVVTSAMHIPRSVGIFRRAGWPVLAWPVDYRTLAGGEVRTRLDLGRTLSMLDDALHEWIGLLAYSLMDRTSAWFPGP